MARADGGPSARRGTPVPPGPRRVRRAVDRLAAGRRPRPGRVPLRLYPAARLASAAAVVCALSDAGYAGRRGLVARRRRRCASRAVDGSALRRVGRRVGRGCPRLRNARRAARRGRSSCLPGVCAHVSRAFERALLCSGVRALGIARDPRGSTPLDQSVSLRRVGRRAACARPPGECPAARVRALTVCAPRGASRADDVGRRFPRRSDPPARGLGSAERHPLRRLHAGTRRQRRRPVLSRVHHRPNRGSGQRTVVTATRQRCAAAPDHARSLQVVRRDCRQGLLEWQLPDSRGHVSALGSGVRLEQQLLDLAEGRDRGGTQASGQIHLGRVRDGVAATEQVTLPRERSEHAKLVCAHHG
jgi:hypothetical protein